MKKEAYKPDTQMINNKIFQENKRKTLINKIKNRHEEKNGEPMTVLTLNPAIKKSSKSASIIYIVN